MGIKTISDPMLIAQKTKDGGMTVMLDPIQVGSAAAGGLILADIARHFSRALVASGLEKSEAAAIGEMRRLFMAEMDHPTDLGEGSLVN